jgi:hypothetical protein
MAREAAMNVRDMKGNPGIWEKLSWADLSSKEKDLWTDLGWREEKWDINEAPASTNTEWRYLSYKEQNAAASLGFTENIWNNFEDE